MRAFDFLSAVASVLDIRLNITKADAEVRRMADRLEGSITPEEMRLALIRVMFELHLLADQTNRYLLASASYAVRDVAGVILDMSGNVSTRHGGVELEGIVLELFGKYVQSLAKPIVTPAPPKRQIVAEAAVTLRHALLAGWGGQMSEPKNVELLSRQLEGLSEEQQKHLLSDAMRACSMARIESPTDFAVVVQQLKRPTNTQRFAN